jgi:hypothetical protein
VGGGGVCGGGGVIHAIWETRGAYRVFGEEM